MKVFKYGGTYIYDAKDLFDSRVGMESLSPLRSVVYNGETYYFSGFDSFGEGWGKQPLLISKDEKNERFYVWINWNGNVLMFFLWRELYKAIRKMNYDIIFIRAEIDKNNVVLN